MKPKDLQLLKKPPLSSNIKLIILFLIFPFVSNGQIMDSIKVYYRTFCADYHYEFMTVEKFMNSKNNVYVLKDKKAIKKICKEINTLKESKFKDEELPYYLVSYYYSDGKRYLFFTIHPFYELVLRDKSYVYENKLLNILFKNNTECFY